MGSSALDKVQLIQGTPPCMPGKCTICGNSGDKESKFLDIGLELDFYGVVYICENCILSDLLKALDLVTREQYDSLQEELKETKLELDLLKDQNKELFSVLRSFGNLGIVDPSSSSSPEQSDVVETVSEAESISGKTTPAKSRSAKPDAKSGSSNVRVNDPSKKLDPQYDL